MISKVLSLRVNHCCTSVIYCAMKFLTFALIARTPERRGPNLSLTFHHTPKHYEMRLLVDSLSTKYQACPCSRLEVLYKLIIEVNVYP